MTISYRLPSSAVIDRHRHAAPYATLVLSGGYEEAGDAGRHRVRAGEVLIHGAFSAHRDVTARGTTLVLDLPVPFDEQWPSRGTVADADAIVRLAERDPVVAVAALRATLVPVDDGEQDLPDRLRAALADDVKIGTWAATQGRARETLSRQFRQLYGIDAAKFRVEARARRAWRMIVRTGDALADIALASGHADQAHMTRTVKALTGFTPSMWRHGSHRFKTG